MDENKDINLSTVDISSNSDSTAELKSPEEVDTPQVKVTTCKEVVTPQRKVTRHDIKSIVKRVHSVELARNQITGMETAEEFYGKNDMLELLKKAQKAQKENQDAEPDEEEESPRPEESNTERLKVIMMFMLLILKFIDNNADE